MATLIRPRSWGAIKPPPGTGINWGHPLAQGLRFAIPFNEQGGAPVDVASGIQYNYSASPLLWVHSGSARVIGNAAKTNQGTRWRAALLEPVLPLPTGDITVMTATSYRGAGVGAGWGATGQNSTMYCGAYCPFTDGTFYWDYGGNSGANRLSVAGLTYGDDIMTVTAGQPGSAIWQNGILRASSSTAISRTKGTGISSTGQFDIGNQAGVFSGTGNVDVRWGFFHLWNRVLSAAEIEWATAEPFCMYNSPGLHVARYVLPVIAAAAATGAGFRPDRSARSRSGPAGSGAAININRDGDRNHRRSYKPFS